MSMTDFALFGGAPAFDQPLSVGQRYFPSWPRYEAAFRGIFERQYYTEYGPLNQALEQQLQQFLGVKHAICVTNETVGLMMLAGAMGLTGKVILSGYATEASVQSLSWAGLQPVFCDLNPATHQIDPNQTASLIDKDVSAILGVHRWGGACDVHTLSKLAVAHNIQLYFDAAHAFGCAVDGVRIGNFGRAEVFSFHQNNILNAGEGGCISTNDDELAASLRTMRSTAGAGKPVEVNMTVNGRMSEAQCAIALMSLEDFLVNQQNNQTLYQHYATHLATLSGLQVLKPRGVSFSNYQYVICNIDEHLFGLSPGVVSELLKAENVNMLSNCSYNAQSSIPPAAENGLQLPTGAMVSPQSVEIICGLLRKAHHASAEIFAKFITNSTP
jgi:dTDP-4-amino-4,6-dideoxygalactose transaminase